MYSLLKLAELMVRVAPKSDESLECHAQCIEDAALRFREGFAFVEHIVQVEERKVVDNCLVQSNSVVNLLNCLAMASVSNNSWKDLLWVMTHHLARHPGREAARELLPNGLVATGQRFHKGVTGKRECLTV